MTTIENSTRPVTQEGFAMRRCLDCGNLQLAWADQFCLQCWSTALLPHDTPGHGILRSWATYHRDFGLEGFDVPYTVGWIEFPDGPRVAALLVADPNVLQSGLQVSIVGNREVIATASALGETMKEPVAVIGQVVRE